MFFIQNKRKESPAKVKNYRNLKIPFLVAFLSFSRSLKDTQYCAAVRLQLAKCIETLLKVKF